MKAYLSVLLMEMYSCGDTIFNLAYVIRKHGQQIKLMFLSGDVSDLTLLRASRLRVDGFLTSRETIDVVLDGVRKEAAGVKTFSQDIGHRLQYNGTHTESAMHCHSPLQSLTSRELEVLWYLSHGDMVKTIAEKLKLSYFTIKTYKYRIMKKVGITDWSRLARLAIREGMTCA